MKKGTQITRVVITNGKVTAYAKIRNGDEFVLPLTRTQRNIFTKYWKKPEFNDIITKEFGSNILSDQFTVEK